MRTSSWGLVLIVLVGCVWVSREAAAETEAMRFSEKQLAERMALLKKRECAHALKTRIDWTSFGNTTDHRFTSGQKNKISIGGSCDIETGLSYFCKKHGAELVKKLRNFVCVLEKKSDDPFFKQYGFRMGVEGDTLTLFTNLEPLNLNDHVDEWLAVNLRAGPGGPTLEEKAEFDYAEKQLAEGMALLEKRECAHALKTRIDWASFGNTADHRFSSGQKNKISIGGSCDIQMGLSYFCKKQGAEKIKKLRHFVCALEKTSDDPFFREHGFRLGVKGDTLTLYTTLEARNLNDYVDIWLIDHLD